VVEDASESLGALYRGRPVGVLGEIGCLSFNGNKLVTTGGGGMIVTASQEHADRARHLTIQARSDALEYVHDDIGYNYRMPSLNAALGLGQMEQLPAMLETKREIAERYRRALGKVEELAAMPEADWARSTHWLFTILLQRDFPSRAELVEGLRERRIEARSLWVPMHRLDLYRRAQTYRIEWADRLYERAVSLPSSPGLTEGDQARVIAALLELLSAPRPATACRSSG
jgi:dTDP-4-amino-4,6-dideoxygalactose transaminase